MIRRFLHDERGASAIEYALIAGSIFLAIVAVVTMIGGGLRDIFADVAAGFD